MRKTPVILVLTMQSAKRLGLVLLIGAAYILRDYRPSCIIVGEWSQLLKYFRDNSRSVCLIYPRLPRHFLSAWLKALLREAAKKVILMYPLSPDGGITLLPEVPGG